MADLRPYLKIEGDTLYVFDESGEEILYAQRISKYTLELFAQSILEDLHDSKPRTSSDELSIEEFTDESNI